jgi:hypothetical protein
MGRELWAGGPSLLVTQVDEYLSYNFGISENEHFCIYAFIDCALIEGGRRHVTDIERPLNRQHGSHRGKHPVRTAGGNGHAASLAALDFQFQGRS